MGLGTAGTLCWTPGSGALNRGESLPGSPLSILPVLLLKRRKAHGEFGISALRWSPGAVFRGIIVVPG